MTKHLALEFCSLSEPALCRTCFVHPLIGTPRKTVRGKAAGAYLGVGSFEWSRAVRGAALLVLKARLRKPDSEVDLLGGARSLAASLDYALDKQPGWMSEMFGEDSSGNSILKRLVLRSNPGRKRIGPVALTFNTQFFPVANIEIRIGDRAVLDDAVIAYLAQWLEWDDAHQSVTVAA